MVSCPHCKQAFREEQEFKGKTVRCPRCKKSFLFGNQHQEHSDVHVSVPETVTPQATEEEIKVAVPRKIRASLRRPVASSFVELLGIFDWQFKKYLTPLIVKITWFCFVIFCVLLFLAITAELFRSLFESKRLCRKLEETANRLKL